MVWHVWGERREGELPLVLLHGGSGSWTHWLRCIEGLSRKRQLWLPDLPGFGDSDGVPGSGDVDGMLAPLHHGLQRLLGQAGGTAGAPLCELVGFSFGGMAAGLLAAAYPGLARSLTVVGAPGMGLGQRVRLKGWRHLPDWTDQARVHSHNLAALMLHDAARIDAETLALHALNVQRDRLPRRRLSETPVLAQALSSMACPVAAIYGEHDALYAGRMQELAQAFARQAAHFRRFATVADAGHWVMHEQPQAFMQVLDEMLLAPSAAS
nr:alpha/beta hydrolase [Comamonas composti]